MLPHLMTASMRKTGEKSEIVILVATSGDTGKAALEGFADVEGTSIMVFFPNQGVSEVQKRQMLTQEGSNVYVAAVQGNFDDAQSGVKNIFACQEYIDKLAANNMKMSSANSINWGRLLPQIVYYVSAYVDLRQAGSITAQEKINIVVPTGNFGNILAAFYAARMGVPVNRLICAANTNNVLTDFIKTGVYDCNRPFKKTISPSMDILISSNLERLLYELSEHDANQVSQLMLELKEKGFYRVNESLAREISSWFWSDYCSDAETIETIRKTWKDKQYLLDTHTAVAVNVYQKYLEATNDKTMTIIASTASPFKFGSSVAQAIIEPEVRQGKDEFELLYLLEDYTGIKMPAAIRGLENRTIKHNKVCSKDEMAQTLFELLNQS
jgi:threonine synthase